MSRFVALLAVVMGAALIVFPVGTSLFSDTRGAQRITDDFRPAMSPAGLASTEADFQTVRAGGVQFITKAEPAFARQLHMTRPQLDAFIAANFPAIATAVRKIPAYNAYVGDYIQRLTRHHGNFEAADSLPLLGLPIDATPWLMVAMGALLVLAGVLGLRAPSRAITGAILALGLVLLVVPIVASIPSKASQARTITHIGRDSLTQAKATVAHTGARQVDALVNQVENELVPALAGKLHTTPTALVAQISTAYPATTKFLAAWKTRLRAKAFAIAAAQQGAVGDFAKADDIPFRPLPWVLIIPGALLVLAAGLALGRRPHAVPKPALAT